MNERRWYVESNNGYGEHGVIAEFDNQKDAERYARNYGKFYGVRTRVTSV